MHRPQEVSSPRLLEALSSLLVRGRSLQPPLPVPSCPELLPSPSRSSPEHSVPLLCPPADGRRGAVPVPGRERDGLGGESGGSRAAG